MGTLRNSEVEGALGIARALLLCFPFLTKN
jgi:hypothetical protein